MPDLQAHSKPSDAWTHHWRGTLTGSIDLLAKDPVASGLRSFWVEQMRWLRSSGSVVDVGSGPAILARLMLNLGWALEPPLTWWSVDQAELGTGWLSSLPASVQVMDQSDFTAVTPPQGPVDALVSNFGLEYLPIDAAAPAVGRWLRPGGRVCVVMHARDSVIDKVSRQHAQDLELALQDVDLPARAGPLIQAMASAPADPVQRMMHAVDIRDAYNEGVDRLKAAMESRGQASAVLLDLLRSTTDIIRSSVQTGPDVALQSLAGLSRAYHSEWQRLQQMQASALDEPAASAWMNSLSHANGSSPLQLRTIECELGTVAWNLQSTS